MLFGELNIIIFSQFDLNLLSLLSVPQKKSRIVHVYIGDPYTSTWWLECLSAQYSRFLYVQCAHYSHVLWPVKRAAGPITTTSLHQVLRLKSRLSVFYWGLPTSVCFQTLSSGYPSTIGRWTVVVVVVVGGGWWAVGGGSFQACCLISAGDFSFGRNSNSLSQNVRFCFMHGTKF